MFSKKRCKNSSVTLLCSLASSLNLNFDFFLLFFFLFTQHMCSLRCYTDAAKNDIFRLPIDEMFLRYLNDET